jgi:serine/threonine protein kinase
MLILGIKELHDLGYVHRDLKPENVLINLRPLHIVLIDFERATLRTKKNGPTVKGTVGYFPLFKDTRDGSTRWDIWALSAMILEADMYPGEYRNVSNERGSMFKAQEHMRDAATSEGMKKLLNRTMLRSESDNTEGLQFISQQLEKVQWRRYK